MLNFSISYFNEVHNYTPDCLNWIPQKFLKNDKSFDLEIYIVKLKYIDTTPPFEEWIRLVYTEGNVCKNTRNHELQS